jgi:hypothetical protein
MYDRLARLLRNLRDTPVGPSALTNSLDRLEYAYLAEVAELADALRSGRSEPCAHVGSIPTFGIQRPSKRRGDLIKGYLAEAARLR